MTLSVIIPAHGRSALLVRCLKSLDRRADIEYEVCIVDDGSGLDESTIRASADVSYPLIWRSFNIPRGRGAARNEGIQFTFGEIIVFLDSDMEIEDGFLEAHRNSHRNHSHTATIGTIIWPRKDSFTGYLGTRGIAKLKEGDPVPPWYFVTGNASIERNDLPGENPFDESLSGWGGEDLDLGMKLHARGVTFTYAPAAVSFHNFTGDLTTHVTRTFMYGRSTLPILINRYAELLLITRLHLLDSLAWRFLVSKIVFMPVLFVANMCGVFPLPAKLYDYLTYAAYARGWLEGNRT